VVIPGVITRYSDLFSTVRMKLCEQDGGAKTSDLPHPRVPMGIRDEHLFDGQFLTEVVSRASDLNDKKIKYLDVLRDASIDSKLLRDAKVAAKEYGDAIAKALHKQDQKRMEPFTRFVGAVVGIGGTYTLGAPSNIASKFVGAALGAYFVPLLSKIRLGLRSRVELTLDVIEPLESARSSFATLASPLGAHQWTAMIPIDMDATTAHCETLPAFG